HDDGDGANIHVLNATNVLSSSASFDGSTSNPGTGLALPGPYKYPTSGNIIGNPLNPDGTGMFDVGGRILKAAEYNNTIVAAHTVPVAVATSTLASAQAKDLDGVRSGGTGYTVGDILTVVGGTSTIKAQLQVQAVDSNGQITSASVVNAGYYSSLSTITGGVTDGTGTGTGASF